MIGADTKKNYLTTSFSHKKLARYPSLIEALLSVKKAALVTNRDGGFIDFEHAKNGLLAIENLMNQLVIMPLSMREEIFIVDVFSGGGSIGIHLNISEYLAIKANIPLAVINYAQSTADVCHTAFRIAIIKNLNSLFKVLDTNIATIKCIAKKFDDVITLGRTCLQDASPISMGKSISATSAELTRIKLTLEQAKRNLYAISLGGTVMGNGDHAPLLYQEQVVNNLAKLVDLPLSSSTNRYCSAQFSNDVGTVMAELANCTLIFMKFARDLRLLSSGPKGGFAEVSLPKVHEGSSFYKDKNNPIVPETMLQCGFLVLGAHHATQCALQHAELQLNVFDNAICINTLDAIDWLMRCLLLFEAHCLQGLSVNQDRCLNLSSAASLSKH